MDGDVRSWHILHIDDDEDDYILVRSMLSQAQGRRITLDYASSYREGREKLLTKHYDAALVDYDLGAGTGIELIHEMVEQGYSAPLILFTGRGSYAVDVEAMQAGATMYLSKTEASPLLLERIIRYAIERKQAELAQAEVQERFRNVLDNSRDVVYRRNLMKDRLDYMSPVVEQVLGFSVEDLNRMTTEEYLAHIHPDDRDALVAGTNQALHIGSARIEYRFLTASGLYRWVADHVNVQVDRDGRPLYRSGILRDIQDQKLAEEELRANEAKFRRIFAVGAIGAQLWDESGHLQEVNDAYLDLIGYTREEFEAGKINWVRLTSPEYRYLDERSLEQMRAGVIPTPFEKELIRKDGTRVPVLIAVNRLGNNPDGSLNGVAYFFDMSEQRRAIAALQASEERFRLSTQAVAGMLYDWNLLTGENYHSDGVEEMLGFSTSTSMIVNWWVDDMHPDDKSRVQRELQEVLDSDCTFYEMEYRMRHADGHWVHTWDRAVVQRAADGKAVRIVGFATDITERQQLAEENLRQKELLERVMSATPTAIAYLQGPEHRFVFANQAYEHIARGHGPLFGRTVADVWPEAADVFIPGLDSVYQSGSIYVSHDLRVSVLRDGALAEASFDLTYVPITGAQGLAEGIIIQVIETTEELAAREQAKSEQALLNAVLDQMPAGVVIAEAPTGKILRRNASLLNLMQIENRDINHVDAYSRWVGYRADGSPVAASDWPLARSILHGEVVRDEEITIMLPDGSQQAFSINSTPVTNTAGQIVAGVAMMDNITRRKQAEESLRHYMQQLQQSNQDLQDFAFVVSHDLQEPLRKVQAFGDLLLSQSAEGLGEEPMDYIRRMQQASERMRQMIDGMLTYSRISTQARPFERVDLNIILQEVLQDAELRIQQTRARIQADELPVIDADPVQMRQLLQNLVTNAIKYRRPEIEPRIQIGCKYLHNSRVQISVQDNGLGVEQRYLKEIFKPFFRVHASARAEGMGMGLAIVRRIVERHSGSVVIDSHPGEGSTFLITLPLRQETA